MRYLMIFFMLCGFLFAAGSLIDEDTVHFVGQASAFTVGSELITDGDFPDFDNWTEGTGWTVAAGVASQDNNASDLTQNLASLTGKRVYRLQFEVTAYTDGNVTVVFDGVEVGDKSSTGVFTGYLPAIGTDADLDIRSDATFTGSIDNVSVVAWTGDLDSGGGCTLSGDASTGFTGTLSDYMTANGLPIHEEAALEFDDNGSSKVRITAAAWDKTSKVGTLVKCDFSAALDSGEDDGIYEITAATSTTIDIDAAYAVADAALTVSVWIGGAYPDIATAINDSTLSEDPDGTYRKRYICVNVNQEVDAVTDFVAETSENTLREDDGSRKIIGFYDSVSVINLDAGWRVVSDIDEGGTYYSGARKAFNSVEGFSVINPSGKWIEWNGMGNAINILELNTNNFEMRNIKLHNTVTGGAEGLFYVDTSGWNSSFVNCWFDTSSNWQADGDKCTTGAVVDCYIGADVEAVLLVDVPSTVFVNCIFNGSSRTNNMDGGTYVVFNSCLFYKGQTGLASSGHFVINCIFFNQTVACIGVSGSGEGQYVNWNNIFSPAAAADIAINISTGSTTPAGFNNIMYSATAGAVLTNPIAHAQLTPNPPLPVGTIEKDPQFVNAADGDFRLRASSPALNGGIRTLFDGWTTIGANGPYSSPNAGYRSRYNFKGHNYSDR